MLINGFNWKESTEDGIRRYYTNGVITISYIYMKYKMETSGYPDIQVTKSNGLEKETKISSRSWNNLLAAAKEQVKNKLADLMEEMELLDM